MSKVQRKRSMGAFFVVKKCSKNESGVYSRTTQGPKVDLNRLFRVRNLMVFRVFSFRVKKKTLNKMIFRVLLFKVKKRLFRVKKNTLNKIFESI